MVHIINKEDSVYNRFLAELRDKEIQKIRYVFAGIWSEWER